MLGCGGSDELEADPSVTGGDTAAPAPEPRIQPAQNGCAAVEVPEPREDGGFEKPKGGLSRTKEYELVVTTNCGRFTIELDPSRAPEATASLVSLARKDFFDDTVITRIAPGFVIQAGDPTGTGGGGPGYETLDKPPKDTQYTKGVVAMAKGATDPPGSGGSQFFIVTGRDIGLPADYAVVGEVKDGLEVVERIGQLGNAAEQPIQLIVIEDIAVDAR